MSQIVAAPDVSRGTREVRRWRAFAVLAVAFFMTVADLAIVNVALPTIGRKLHMAESDLQWVVTGYGLIGLAAVPVTFLLVRRGELAKAVATATALQGREPGRASR